MEFCLSPCGGTRVRRRTALFPQALMPGKIGTILLSNILLSILPFPVELKSSAVESIFLSSPLFVSIAMPCYVETQTLPNINSSDLPLLPTRQSPQPPLKLLRKLLISLRLSLPLQTRPRDPKTLPLLTLPHDRGRHRVHRFDGGFGTAVFALLLELVHFGEDVEE